MSDSRSIVLIIGILGAYCLYLGQSELAATCVGALAGVLTQHAKSDAGGTIS